MARHLLPLFAAGWSSATNVVLVTNSDIYIEEALAELEIEEQLATGPIEDEEEDLGFSNVVLEDLCLKVVAFCEELADSEFFPYQREFGLRLVQSFISNDGEEVTALQARQCLDGDTVVFRRDGSACRLRDHEDAWSTGEKPTKRYKIQGGAEIIATDNHPVMTDRGWVPAGL